MKKSSMKKAIEKEQLRKKLLEMRSGLEKDEISLKSAGLCRRLTASKPFQDARVILGYMPVRNEISPVAAMQKALADGKALYLPRVISKTQMEFYRVRDLSSLCTGSYGILEPAPLEPLEKKQGLMLLPGVGFDRSGFRLGYGGGYYDRYLEADGVFYTIGLCFGFQLLEKLPVQKNDQPVKMIATEEQVYIRMENAQ